MNPEWINAGAAVIQAAGSVGAIFYAVKIANDAAERERKADAAAIERAEAAEQAAAARELEARKAAAEREQEANRRAEARIKQAEDAEHNSIIDRIIALGMVMTSEWNDQLAQANIAFPDTYLGPIHGSLAGRHSGELHKALVTFKQQTGDIELLRSIDDLDESLTRLGVSAQGGIAYRASIEKVIQMMGSMLARVYEQRR